MNILSGDIGGTKTLLQLSRVEDNGSFTAIDRQHFKSAEYADFETIVSRFLSAHANSTIQSACFGVAGPINQEEGWTWSQITNLPWCIDAKQISVTFSIPSVELINDFQAVGYGITALKDNEFSLIQKGRELAGNKLIIGAGTGLGVALWINTGGQDTIIATEGGHAHFAPATKQQLALSEFLLDDIQMNSVEAVVSGPGVFNIYRFIACSNEQLDSERYKDILSSDDPSARIAQYASEGDEYCSLALDLFIECYGGQAGNLALSSMARGGVYIAGGIAPKLIERMRSNRFTHAFNSKSKMATLLEDIPIRVVMNTDVGLLGSQVVAARLAKD